ADVGVHFGAVAGDDPGEFLHHASHPADRHFPFPGAIADEMVEKTAVLEQRRVVGMCEKANLTIGKNNAAQQIVLQVTFNRQTERSLDQTAPGLGRVIILFKLPRELVFGTKRAKHRLPKLIGEDASQAVELLQLLEFRVVPRQFTEGRAADRFRNVAQEKTARGAISLVGGKRGGGAGASV